MRYEVLLPELGENIHHANVLRIMVAIGDLIRQEQPLLELETDKATTELPSPAAGRVAEVKIKAGEEVHIGQVLLVLEAQGTAPNLEPSQPLAKPTVPAQPVQSEKPLETTEAPQPPSARPTAPLKPPEDLPAAPAVRRLARELGVALETVIGTGPTGRISIEDVKRHAKEKLSAPPAASPSASRSPVSASMMERSETPRLEAPPPAMPVSPPLPVPAALSGPNPISPPPLSSSPVAAPAGELPDFSRFGPVERMPMSGVRYATAMQVARTWAQVPQVTQHDRADITDLEALRQRYKPQAEAMKVKLTPTVFVLKALASALKVFPSFNSSIDMARRELVVKRAIHIGVAVDAGYGLVVPVLRDVDRGNWLSLARQLGDVSERARSRTLPTDAYKGGGFTLTNLGGLGTTYFSPLVNWPEVAILGVGRATQEPVFNGESFVPRLLMPLSLSYDHRAIDGAEAARFLRWVAEALEQPLKLLLEG